MSNIAYMSGFRKRELPDIIAQFSKDKEKTKKKSVSREAKLTLHGLTDSKTERHVFALMTRTNALWETVKPINVAVKIKTELFAPKSAPVVRAKARVSWVLQQAAVTVCPGSLATTAFLEQSKWDHLRGCALFSVTGEQNYRINHKLRDVSVSHYSYTHTKVKFASNIMVSR